MTDILSILEYDKVLARIAEFATTDIGKRAILQIVPMNDLALVQKELDTVAESFNKTNPIKQFVDITDILQKTRIGAVLSKNDLLSIYQTIVCSANIQRSLGIDSEYSPNLYAIAQQIIDCTTLQNSISSVIDDYGEIKDNATSTLKSIRKSIHYTNQRLREKLSSYTKQGGEYARHLQESIVTVRNGRFVIPVKTESRGQVEGLLHDQSASGSTLFIEPVAIVNLNNELKKLSMDEDLEIHHILQDLSTQMVEYIATLDNNVRICVLVDTIFAKSAYAKSTNSIQPLVNQQGIIHLQKVRHPLIDIGSVVPIDIQISKKRVLLISGPNTGGKTVTIKTLGLMSLLAASGIYLPCQQDSEISIFDQVYCCLGDEQSIAGAFSTFSSHILRIKEILQNTTPNSLVLIDELGTGTDPEEGVVIAMAITEYILQLGCVAAITSHYGRLKDFGIVDERIESASMHFDNKKLESTYQLLLGVAGASNAIAICQRLGLPKIILDNAKRKLSEDSIEYNNLLEKTQKTYFLANQKLLETQELNTKLVEQLRMVEVEKETLIKQQNKVIQNANREIETMLNAAKQEAVNIIEQIKDKLMIADETALLQAKQLFNHLDKQNLQKESTLQYQNLEKMPQKGDRIIVKSIGSQGVVKEILRDTIFVTVGVATIKCTLDNLATVTIQQNKQPNTSKKVVKIKDIKGAESNDEMAEINVIGQTVTEAIINIEPFLENCHISGRKKLRIVHGKGTGILGKSIQKYLRTIKYIKEYHYAGYGEGERGVTIVVL